METRGYRGPSRAFRIIRIAMLVIGLIVLVIGNLKHPRNMPFTYLIPGYIAVAVVIVLRIYEAIQRRNLRR